MGIASCSDIQMPLRLQFDHGMKRVFCRPSRWHTPWGFRAGYGRSMHCQAVAEDETQIKEVSENNARRRWRTNETEILIAAKRQQDLRNSETLEKAGIPLINEKTDWKEIESICNHRGVQRSAEQCKGRWRRLLLTYIQIKCWERNKTSEHSSFWSMVPDEKRATGVLLSNLDESIYNLLDGHYGSRADSVDEALIENADEVSDSGNEHKILEEDMRLPLTEISEVTSMETSVNTIHEQASEQASAPIADKNISADVNLPPRYISDVRDSQSVFAEADCEIQKVHTVDAVGDAEDGHRHMSTQMEFTSADMGFGDEKQTQHIIESTVSVDQACEAQRTTRDGVPGVEAHDELPAQRVADKHIAALGNRLCVVEEQSPEEDQSLPSLNCQENDTAVEYHVSENSSLVSMLDGNDFNPGTDVEAYRIAQNEQIAGGDVSNSTMIKVPISGVEGWRPEDDKSLPFKVCQGVAEDDTIHGLDGDLAESLQHGTDKGSMKHEADFTGVEISDTIHIKQAADIQGLKISTLSVKMVSDVQERTSPNITSLASHEVLLSKSDASTTAEVSCKVQAQHASGSSLSMSTSVEADLAQSEEIFAEDSHLQPSEICDRIITAVENAEDSSRAISAEHISDDGSGRHITDSEGLTVFNTEPSETNAGTQALESSQVSHTMIGGSHENVSEDCPSRPHHEEVDTLLEDKARVNLTATSAVYSKHGNAIASLSEQVGNQGVVVLGENLVKSAEPMLGLMAGLRTIAKEDDGNQNIMERMPTTAEQDTSLPEVDHQCTEPQVTEKSVLNSSDMPETVNVKARGLQLYDGKKYDDDVLMYVPAAISNVIRSVSQTLKKIFKS